MSTHRSNFFAPRDLISLSFFPSVFTLFICVVFQLARYKSGVEPAAFIFSFTATSWFILNFPVVTLISAHFFFHKKISDWQLALLSFCCLLLISVSIFLHPSIRFTAHWSIVLAGTFSFLFVFVCWIVNTQYRLVWFSFFILLALFTGSKIWTTGYLYPVFSQRIPLGIWHTDTLFHSSIAGMLMQYQTPSIGIDGILPTRYHFGSHAVLAGFSLLIQAKPIEVIQVWMPAFLHAFFIQTFFFFVHSVRQYFYPDQKKTLLITPQAILLFLTAYIGFLPLDAQNRLNFDVPQFFSESQVLATSILFLFFTFFFSFLGKKTKPSENFFFLIIFLGFVAIIGSVKISHAYLAVLPLLYVLIRTKKVSLSTFVFLSVSSLAVLFILLAKFSIQEHSPVIQPFSLWTKTVYHYWKGWWLPLIFIWGLIFLHLRFKISGLHNISQLILAQKEKKLLDIEFLTVVSVCSLFPGMILSIPGGGALYFYDFQRWISLALLISLMSGHLFINRQYRKLSSVSTSNFVVVLFSLAAISTILLNLLTPIKSFIDSVQPLSYTPTQQQHLDYLTILLKTPNNLPKGTLLSGTQLNTFELPLDCYALALLIPAFTTYATLQSSALNCPDTEYTFSTYTYLNDQDFSEDICTRLNRKQFQTLIEIDVFGTTTYRCE